VTEYSFTQDWFHWAPPVLERLVPLLPERKRFLEIGSFEGRSTVWLAENMLEDGGVVVAIDTWEGGEEHESMNMGSVEDRFDHNMNVLKEKFPKRYVSKVRADSYHALAVQSDHRAPYDFIYVDGSHVAKDVLTDLCMAWPLLKDGGIMVMDDYLWGEPRDILHRPKMAIDAFMNVFAEAQDILHVGYQVAVRKKG
jgi:predicted O-methyltransferase YrrM